MMSNKIRNTMAERIG